MKMVSVFLCVLLMLIASVAGAVESGRAAIAYYNLPYVDDLGNTQYMSGYEMMAVPADATKAYTLNVYDAQGGYLTGYDFNPAGSAFDNGFSGPPGIDVSTLRVVLQYKDADGNLIGAPVTLDQSSVKSVSINDIFGPGYPSGTWDSTSFVTAMSDFSAPWTPGVTGSTGFQMPLGASVYMGPVEAWLGAAAVAALVLFGYRKFQRTGNRS